MAALARYYSDTNTWVVLEVVAFEAEAFLICVRDCDG